MTSRCDRVVVAACLTFVGLQSGIAAAQPEETDAEQAQGELAPEADDSAFDDGEEPTITDEEELLLAPGQTQPVPEGDQAKPPPSTLEQFGASMDFYGVALVYADLLRKSESGWRGRLNSGTTGLGVRGTVDSPYGISALYQIEMGLQIDQNGVGPSPSSAFPLRNSAVGIQGVFGSVRFGNWDTPAKMQIMDIGPVRGLNPFDGPLRMNPGHGAQVVVTEPGYRGNITDVNFLRRQGNMIQYWAPEFKGLKIIAALSPNETKTTVDGAEVSPFLAGGSVRYDRGGLSLRYGYEFHKDYFGLSQLSSSAGTASAPSATNETARDDVHVAVASYRFGSTRVVGTFDHITYRNDDSTAGNLTLYRRSMFEAYAEQSFGPHKVFGEFAFAGPGSCELAGGGNCNTDGLGAAAWAVGYAFALSPAASMYTAIQEIRNQRNARYATFPPVGGTAAGEDYFSWGVGFIVVL